MATSSSQGIIEVNVELDNKKLISFYVAHDTTLQKVRELINKHQPLKETQFFLNQSGFPIGRADESLVPIHKLIVSEGNGLVKMQTHASNSSFNDQICNPEKFDVTKWENILTKNNLFKGLIFSNDKYEPVSSSPSPVVQFKPSISVAKIIVDTMNTSDYAFIEAYLSSNERHSTLIKNKLVKLDANFQCPFISFVAGGEGEQSNMTDKKTKTLYTTCTWSFPRVKVHLFDTTMSANQQYLVPADQFRKEIEEVFESASSIENRYSQLEDIFKRYGQVYPKSVILGGHLYQTDVQTVDKSKDEEEHRAVVCTQFKGFIDKIFGGVGGGGGGGGEQETQDKQRKTETSYISLSQCEATGGQTLLVGKGNIGDWISSIGDSNWWRVIQYGELIPTYKLLDKESQKKIDEVEQHHKKSFSKFTLFIFVLFSFD